MRVYQYRNYQLHNHQHTPYKYLKYGNCGCGETDVDCNNDLQPVPSLFKTAKSSINKFSNGSYILMNFNTTKHDQFYIYKKGSQGLYYSIDEDNNLHFASDVYGLINKTEK